LRPGRLALGFELQAAVFRIQVPGFLLRVSGFFIFKKILGFPSLLSSSSASRGPGTIMELIYHMSTIMELIYHKADPLPTPPPPSHFRFSSLIQ